MHRLMVFLLVISILIFPVKAESSDKLVALTFDDGPNNNTTVDVLNILEEYGVKASFFVIGNNITKNTKPILKRTYAMGCEICNHSKSHYDMTKLTPDEIRAEVEYVTELVTEITGEPTRFFRPPYIAVNQTMYDVIDMPFICGMGCDDWDNNVSADERTERILSQVKDGTIILLHDMECNDKTVTALKTIIPSLLEKGYEFVTVSELFEIKGIELSPDDANIYTYVGK